MKKFILILPLCFLLAAINLKIASAQENNLTIKEEFRLNGSLRGVQVTRSNTETTGSPYLNKKFVKGVLILDKGTNSQTIYLRYDMAKNRVEFLRNKEILVANSKKIKGFKLFGKTENIIFKNGYHTNIDDINPHTFLRTAYKGADLKLVVFHKAHLMKDIARYNSASKQNRYTYKNKYYLITQKGEFHRLKSKEDVLETLSDQKNKIEEYAQSNDLDFKKESDLIKILKYYSRLHQEMSK